jgi:hypothetical protein
MDDITSRKYACHKFVYILRPTKDYVQTSQLHKSKVKEGRQNYLAAQVLIEDNDTYKVYFI